jgi:hypothetical protein
MRTRAGVVGSPALCAALAVIVSGAGCGSSLDKSNAPATASAACMQLHAASAERSARCTGGTVGDWRAYSDSQDDCAAYDRHVAEGKVAYRPGGWDACVAEYAGPCDRVLSFCFWDILHGMVPDGQPCQDTEVCGTVSACLDVDSLAASCGQVCVRAGKENETCGLYCGGTAPCVTDFPIPICEPTLACANSVCVKPKTAGQSCGGGDPVPCATFLSCSADPADPQSVGTCQAHASGGACRSDADCVGTEFCLNGLCTGRLQPGTPCADAPTGCPPWTACDASGVCVAAGRPGLPCAPFPGTPDFLTCAVGACLDGAVCSGYAGTGESCVGTVCLPGNECDAAILSCVACPP